MLNTLRTTITVHHKHLHAQAANIAAHRHLNFSGRWVDVRCALFLYSTQRSAALLLFRPAPADDDHKDINSNHAYETWVA